MELTGINVKKFPDANAYNCVTQVVFPDSDGTLRCGRLASCIPIAPNNKWVAVVGRWLFTKTWDPKTDRFDPEDDIMGKDCYVGEWTTPFYRANICHLRHNIIRPTIKIGSVVQVKHPFATVLLTTEFVESNVFKEQGFWVTWKDQPRLIKPDDKIFMVVDIEHPKSASNTTHHAVVEQLKPENMLYDDGTRWPEDNDPISCVRYLFR